MTIKKQMENLVKEYKSNEEHATRDLSGWPRQTLAGATMAKNQAQTRLPQLFKAYSDVLSQSTTYLLAYGNDEQFEEFAKDLEKMAKGAIIFTDSTMSLYEYLSPRVEQNMTAARNFDSHSLMILVSEMAVLGKELGRDFIMEPKIQQVTVTPDHASVVSAIRSSIMANSGYSFMLEYLQNSFTKNALKTGYAANNTIFVLRCLNESEAFDLSTSKSFPVDLSETDETGYTQIIKELLKINKGQ